MTLSLKLTISKTHDVDFCNITFYPFSLFRNRNASERLDFYANIMIGADFDVNIYRYYRDWRWVGDLHATKQVFLSDVNS
jgi:hypothetical protein